MAMPDREGSAVENQEIQNMSEYVDLRMKISQEIDSVLEAESLITGESKQDIARKVLNEYKEKKIKLAKITHELLLSKGLPGIQGGSPGHRRDLKGG